MKPFEVSETASKLTQVYLRSETLRNLAPALEDGEIFGVIQQWLTEGIPYVFRDSPLLYEAIRSWLAFRIGVHPKEITLIGSGRLGYSTQSSSFGRPFGEHSDLDFTAISNQLFQQGRKSFERWKWEYRFGLVKPKNSSEDKRWKENLERLPNNIRRGFISPYLIPNRYDWPKRISQSMWKVHEKLKETPSSPMVRKVSLRVYVDWRAFVKQMQINFSSNISYL